MRLLLWLAAISFGLGVPPSLAAEKNFRFDFTVDNLSPAEVEASLKAFVGGDPQPDTFLDVTGLTISGSDTGTTVEGNVFADTEMVEF